MIVLGFSGSQMKLAVMSCMFFNALNFKQELNMLPPQLQRNTNRIKWNE